MFKKAEENEMSSYVYDGSPVTVAPLTAEERTIIPDEIRIELENAVYRATYIIEKLEGQGHIQGNGHNIRQQITTFAVRMLVSRWRE